MSERVRMVECMILVRVYGGVFVGACIEQNRYNIAIYGMIVFALWLCRQLPARHEHIRIALKA